MTDQKIRCAVFDVDGTLLDSMNVWWDLGEMYLRKKGYEPTPDLGEKIKVMNVPEAAEYIRDLYHMPETVQKVTEEIEDTVRDFYYYKAEAKPGAVEYVKKLRGRGMRIFVATASERDPVEHALSRVGILPYVEHVFAGTELGCGKSDAAYWGKVAVYAGVDIKDLTIFEDSLHAVQSAAAVGCRLNVIYDRYSAEDEDALRRLADIYAKDFSEMPEKL